jgi:hypothetical protein
MNEFNEPQRRDGAKEMKKSSRLCVGLNPFCYNSRDAF